MWLMSSMYRAVASAEGRAVSSIVVDMLFDARLRPEEPSGDIVGDVSLGLSSSTSSGRRFSGFSLQIFMNCNKKSRSYLPGKSVQTKWNVNHGKYLPELAILSVDIELNLRPFDAFRVSNVVDVFDVPCSSECRR